MYVETFARVTSLRSHWPTIMQLVTNGDVPPVQDVPAVGIGSARTLKTLPEVLAALSAVQSKETALATSLSALLEAREPLRSSLARLSALTQTVQGLKDESGSIAKKVGVTAQTAERVRGKVQALDEEMRRVREAGERVTQVMDLKVLPQSISVGVSNVCSIRDHYHRCKQLSTPKTGRQLLDIVPEPCPCPKILYLGLLQSPPWQVYTLCDVVYS